MDSFLRNCFLSQRHDGGTMFYADDTGVYARLDGYAIIPKETYEALQRKSNRHNRRTRKQIMHLRRSTNCGVHSGFPKCCIKFFETAWQTKTEEQHRLYESMIQNTHGSVGYIMCPMCIFTGNIVEVLKCDCSL